MYAYWPTLVWYEATYVCPAVIATGDGNVTVCQPVAVSFVKVAVARGVPVLVHRLPMWVPVLVAPL